MQGYLYINGEWTGENLGRIDVINPANGEVVGTVPNGGENETRNAIQAAHEAFQTWSKTTAKVRNEYLKRFNELILKNVTELAELVTLEMGKPLREAKGEVMYAASFIEWYGEECKRIYGETVPANDTEKRIVVIKQPVGVVAAITPWNFPAAMITRKMGPALAAGCTFFVKPSELTPLTAVKLIELAHEAGFPRGVVNMVTGDPEKIGREILHNEKVRKISFTGSTEVGKMLIKQGANQVKRFSLELGGHAPIIVLDDADIDKAVKGVMASKFRNAGQTCICGNRIYVQSGIYDLFVKRLRQEASQLKVGNGMDNNVDIGPLINKKAYEKVDSQVKEAIANGAKCVLGGSGEEINSTYFYAPTILTEVNKSMMVMNEETFGPVAPVQKFATDEEAVKMANDSPYGLAAYVFSESLSRGTKVVENLEFGIIGWNDGAPSTAQAPFGGMKESGMGKEGGHQGIESFLETKYVSVGL